MISLLLDSVAITSVPPPSVAGRITICHPTPIALSCCPACQGTGVSPWRERAHRAFSCRVCHGRKTLPTSTLTRIESQRADMRAHFPITI